MSSNVAEDTSLPEGRVEGANSAVITIVHEAVFGCYGIVDFASRSFCSSIVHKPGFGSESHGIAVSIDGTRVAIDVSVVVEYGTPIFTLASNVMQGVTFQVERTPGMDVERVNLDVGWLHPSQPSRSSM